MRHSNRWLRGGIGWLSPPNSPFEGVFFFFPGFAKPSAQLWGRRSRGCGAVPGGWGQWLAPAVTEGTAVAQGLLAALGV